MRGLRSSRTIVIGVALVVFAICCVLPLAYMVALSLRGGREAASPFAALLLDARQRGLLWNTVVVGGGTALAATSLGVPLGVALARVKLRWKAAVRLILATPLLLPPYVMGLAWLSLAGPAGLLARSVDQVVRAEWIYSTTGVIAILTFVYYPLPMLATEVAVRRIEPRLEEAALLVAAPGRVLRRITLPLAAPAIIAAALLVFVLGISEFGVPALLRVRVYTTEVFTAFAALYDFSRATVLALPLLVLSGAIAAAAILLIGGRLIVTRRAAAAMHTTMLDAWSSVAGVAAACVATVALVLPILALTVEASRVRSWLAVIGGSGTAIFNSLFFATVGATLVVIVGLWVGYGRARARPWAGVMADVLFVVLFAVPSTIVGIGLIGLWNRPGPLGALYGTGAMLVLVALARFLPVAALGVAAAARQVPTSHEEAAAAAGAGWGRTMWRIVIPQMKSGLLATWVIAFVLMAGELGASILVAPPGEATLPVRLYTLVANAPPANLAALALLQSAIIIAPLIVLAWSMRARGPQ